MISDAEKSWMLRLSSTHPNCVSCCKFHDGKKGTSYSSFQRHLVSKHGYWVKQKESEQCV